MAPNLGRWLKYAQARLQGTLDAENAAMDDLEAEQAAAVADKPWLASDREAPTFDEAKARIEWESAQQAERAAAADGPGGTSAAGSKAQPPEDPEVAAAKVELEERDRAAKQRLDAIRDELGVEPPKGGG